MSSADFINPYAGVAFNLSFRVNKYELDLDYRIGPNRLRATATLHIEVNTRTSYTTLDFTSMLGADLVDAISDPQAHSIDVKRWRHSGHRLRVTFDRELVLDETLRLVVTYSGTPRPVCSKWSDTGREELENDAFVAPQSVGAASWYPCDDDPKVKAFYEFAVVTDASCEIAAPGLADAPVNVGGPCRR